LRLSRHVVWPLVHLILLVVVLDLIVGKLGLLQELCQMLLLDQLLPHRPGILLGLLIDL